MEKAYFKPYSVEFKIDNETELGCNLLKTNR